MQPYLRVLTVLALNLPLVALPLLANLRGMETGPGVLLYVAGIIIGYYGLLLLVGVTVLSLVLFFVPRILYVLVGAALTLFHYYLFLDNRVYAVCRFHIDPFWMNYVLHDPGGIGLSVASWIGAGVVLIVLAAIEFGLFRLARRLRPRGGFAPALVGLVLAAFAGSQVTHVMAYERSLGRITSLTPRLPFYVPVTSHRNAVKYGELLPITAASEAAGDDSASASMAYPLCACPAARPTGPGPRNVILLVLESWRYDALSDSVTPNIHALGQQASVFRRHFSSGNATTPGIFGLFYGLYGTYWTAVKANNARLHNPLLIDLMEEAGYAFGIYADSNFKRHKIKDAMFRDITVHEAFDGDSRPEKEADMVNRMIAFLREPAHRERPFLLFGYFKASHHNFYYPDSFRIFTPVKELNAARGLRRAERAGYLNDYYNALYFDDYLIGKLLGELDALGLTQQTMIVVTTDHGEQFDDDGAGYWGHTSNFTRYQTQVPLIFYYPGRAPRIVDVPTSHVDIPTTLIQEVFGVRVDPTNYANGRNLFQPLPAERALVIASDIGHAFLIGDNVYEVSPVHLRSYRLENIEAGAERPRPDLMRNAVEEMGRFQRPAFDEG